MHSMAPRESGLNQDTSSVSATYMSGKMLRRGTLTSMQNPSSRNTGTFPDFAIPRANAFSFKLTRNCTGFLCAAQTRNQPALIHVQLREDGEDGGCAASATTRVFVSAYGLCWAWVCREGERMGQEECPCSDDA
jgi:hypothetical protein